MYDELIKRLRETSIDFGESDHVSVMLIEAANAIEDLQKQLEESYNSGYTHGLDDAAEVDLVKKMSYWWIPVTERLPEEEEVVLVWGGASVYTAKRHNKYGELMWWKLNSRLHYCNPTHWMPLPEPPKEKAE